VIPSSSTRSQGSSPGLFVQLLVLLSVVALLLACGCSGSKPAPGSSDPVLSEQDIYLTWVWKAAFDESLPEEMFVVLTGRWLGGVEANWTMPGQSHGVLKGQGGSAALRLLASRQLLEDRLALEHLGALHAHASCRLAQDPDAFGLSIPEGYLLGAAACESLGDSEGAKVANSHVAGAKVDLPSAPSRSSSDGVTVSAVADLLVPQVKVVDVRGERLEYVLLQAAQITAAVDLLGGWSKAAILPEPVPADLGQFIASAAATSRWSMKPGTGSALIPGAEGILASAPAGSGRLAQVESLIEEAIAHWQRGLAALPRDGEGALDSGGRALLDRWFRRALYRDVGLAALQQGDAELALLALEEAAEARGRVRPAAGADPLLLAALARARYQCNELQRAVELLDDIARTEGWELAAPVARTIARVAVVGSGADAKVNR